MQITEAIELLEQGANLSEHDMQSVMDQLMSGEAPDSLVASLLGGLFRKGETADELTGAARSLRSHMHIVRSRRQGVVDTCGTGGSGLGTFNISTASAIVAAAAGAQVAKHGNRRSTGVSGSSDVLQELGVNVAALLPVVERCLEELGLCFCFAPLHHSSVRHVMEVRRSLPHPTIFNWIGPLCNPARASFQLLGAGQAARLRPLAEALSRLGTERGLVIHSRDGLGELSTQAVCDGWWADPTGLTACELSTADFGCPASNLDSMLVQTPAESAAVIRGVLNGRAGPPREITLMNAAAVLWTCGRAADPAEGYEQSAAAIDSGRAQSLLTELARLSQEAAP